MIFKISTIILSYIHIKLIIKPKDRHFTRYCNTCSNNLTVRVMTYGYPMAVTFNSKIVISHFILFNSKLLKKITKDLKMLMCSFFIKVTGVKKGVYSTVKEKSM